MDFSVFMEHEVDVYGPPTVTAGSAGGDTITWPTVRAAGVECLLNASPATEQDRFAQPGLVGTVTGATYYAGLQRGDKIRVTSGPTLQGVWLRITAIKEQPGVDMLAIDDLVHFTGEFQK